MYAKVIVDVKNASVDRLFTYTVPEDTEILEGHRVLVPFGAGNKRVEGFVMELTEELGPSSFRVKSIISRMEPYTVLTQAQLSLARWMKDAYNCLMVDALRVMIPSELRSGRVGDKRERVLMLPPDRDAQSILDSMLKKDGTPRSKKQYEIVTFLAEYARPISSADLSAYIDDPADALRSLTARGDVLSSGREVLRDPFAGMDILPTKPMQLTPEQLKALDCIISTVKDRSGSILLHGVTGSGKTEVYMQAVARVVEDGGTAIVLVPEISLTPQAMDRFKSRFGERVAVLHSRLTPGERYDEWKRIRLGKVDVVIGARSAVFAPLERLRLIVIDEEHELSYRSETVPRYSAADVAQKRCRLEGAALVMGSATPSLETYYRAVHGKYKLMELSKRINDTPMPLVEIADMRQEFMAGNSTIFSMMLEDRLKRCLDSGQQAILFMNRRGYSTFVSCRACGYVFKCPDCDVSMTYHKAENVLRCHYCSRVERVPEKCPQCGKPYIKFFGIGTQQVEEQLYERFPGVTSIRMDLDTTRTKNAHYELLKRFADGRAQVLIGTQMIAKGLDIPNVTLVGVIAADASLHIPDFRSSERTFQLLTQVAGRAGREKSRGNVVVQTYTPDHPVIGFAREHDFKGFYESEIKLRRAALFPPFSVFVRILFTGDEEAHVECLCSDSAQSLLGAVTKALETCGGDKREILFLMSSAAPIRKREGKYRYQCLLKLVRTKYTGAAIKAVYEWSDNNRAQGMGHPEVNPIDLT